MLRILQFTAVLLLLLVPLQEAKAQSTSLGDTIFSFNAGVMTPTPDRGLNGIVYADRYFYITGFDPDDNYNHKLYFCSESGRALDRPVYGIP